MDARTDVRSRLRFARLWRDRGFPSEWWDEQLRLHDASVDLCAVLGEGAKPSYNPYAACYDGGVTLTRDAAERVARIIEQKED